MSACTTGPETQSIDDPVSGKDLKIELMSFTIACDLEKGLGIAYFMSVTTYDDNYVGGMLSKEDFIRFCVPAAEKAGKRVN